MDEALLSGISHSSDTVCQIQKNCGNEHKEINGKVGEIYGIL